MKKGKQYFMVCILALATNVSHGQIKNFNLFIKSIKEKKEQKAAAAKVSPKAEQIKKVPKTDTLVKVQKVPKTDTTQFADLLKQKTKWVKDLAIKANQKLLANTSENNVYIFGGINFSKQYINTGNYNSNFSYDLANYNKAAFKPGYFAGFRLDGKYKQKHKYAFIMSLNKIASGTSYNDPKTLAPFLGTYSKFKADDQFFTLSTALYYKKLLTIGDTSKRKFYIVGGPSIETRLSGQSTDNLVNYNYHRFLLRGDLGLEFDNRSNYTIFLHYKQGITSFTRSPISTTMNSVELGVMLKANDIF